MMAETSRYWGGLIAFEGSQDILSTQCQLLPSSPDILVLPVLEQFMPEETHHSAFSPESYILRVHEACNARAERAYSFLKETTPNGRRLVFMNGGTASARMKCIAAISERYGKGGIAKAEHLFNEIIRDGVEGLRQAFQATPESYPTPASNEPDCTSPEEDNHDQSREPPSNPICEAMRAADALDRRTESLQSTTELNLMIPILRRSRSLPIRRLYIVPDTPSSGFSRASDDALDESHSSDFSDEMYRSGAPPSYDSLTPRSITFESAPATPVIIGEACLIDVRPLNSKFSARGLRSVDYLYASPVLNRDISLCDIHPSGSSNLDVGNQNIPNSHRRRTSRSKRLSKVTSTSLKSARRRGPPSPLILTRSNRRLSSYSHQSTNMRHDYVHHSTYTENNYVDKGSNTDEAGTSPTFWDRDSASGDTSFQEVLPMVEDMVIHFKEAKPDRILERILRDLKEPRPQPISAPGCPVTEPEKEDKPEISRNPTPKQPAPRRSTRQESDIGTRGAESLYELDADEYDPFASHGDYLHSCTTQSPKRGIQARTSQIQPPVPPTPAYTPSPQQVTPPPLPSQLPPLNKRFYELNITTCRTAIEIQDTLRSALWTYFPPSTGDVVLQQQQQQRQPEFPSISEIRGDWQPVFSKRKLELGEFGEQKRGVDLILAIGAQDGVEKEFLSALRGSLEKLGTKPKGMTRSGRLDLRYLIVNAQRAFAAQLFPDQTPPGDLSSDSRLLATSIIPFLETYMAVHTETGFLLLEYPPEHLSTVLALQELIGSDILKVAGILDDKTDDLGRPNYGNGITKGLETPTMTTTTTTTTRGSSKSPKVVPSFSKANFIITSSATESEIATFIAAVWKSLVDRSYFYIPDGAPTRTACIPEGIDSWVAGYGSNNSNNSSSRRFAQSPLINTTVQYTPLDSAAVMMGFQELASTSTLIDHDIEGENKPATPSGPPVSDALLADGTTKNDSSNNDHNHNHNYNNSNSNSNSPNTNKTTKTTQSRKAKLRSLLGRELDEDGNKRLSIRMSRPGTASFFDASDDDGDEDDDEDDRFAADERRYMPLFMKKKHEVRKGQNSRKALRFLGLSTGD